jgi:serine/threonine protein kinase
LENAGVDRVMLTDFGLARAADDASLTRSGVIPGTPQYMSPEQARGETADYRSDLFSLGSVLYAMCAGHPPFRAETALAVLRRISDEAPRPIREVNPDTPRWLARIIERLHAKRPEDRYPSASAFADVLEQCLAYVQQPTLATLPVELAKPARPPGLLVRASLWVTTAMTIAAVAVAIWQDAVVSPTSEHTNPPPTRATAAAGRESRAAQESSLETAWDDGLDHELDFIHRTLMQLELLDQ